MKGLKAGERLDDLQYHNLQIIQNPNGYCFTSDAVMLANFAKAKPGDRVVDLCSGSGVIGILMQAKTGAQQVTLVELQEFYADMSRRSVALNGLEQFITVLNEPLQGVHKRLGQGTCDVVVCNPPYKMEHASLLPQDRSMSICRHEITVTLEEIIGETQKLLKFGGLFYTINKEERLTDLICLLRKYDLEPKELVVLPSVKGSSVVMMKAKKGGKSGIRVSVMTQRM